MMKPVLSVLVALMAVAALASGEEIKLGACGETAELQTSEMLKLDTSGDRKLTFNGESCFDPARPCDTGKYVRCAVDDGADDGGYYNAHSYFTAPGAEESEEKTLRAATSETTNTARLFGSSWGLATSYYYKLPYGVDASESCAANNIKCVTFYPNWDGITIAQKHCDLLFLICDGFGIYEPPNQNPFYCLKRKLGATNYDDAKQSSYPVKLFKRYTTSSIFRLYGFRSFPSATRPSQTSTLKSFSAAANYSKDDCAAMCESDDECNGYSLHEDTETCAALLTMSTTAGGVSNEDGLIYFRQAASGDDELSDCELDAAACPGPGPSATTIGLSVAGTCTVLGVAALIVIQRRRHQRANSVDDNASAAVPAVVTVAAGADAADDFAS